MKKKVILLDLNSTLAEKTDYNPTTYTYNVAGDVYSVALSNALKAGDYEIHLVTARGEKYKKDTIIKINSDIGLEIDTYAFKPSYPYIAVQNFKREYVLDLVANKGYEIEDFIAIESNWKTRAEYAVAGVQEIYTRKGFLDKIEMEGIGI